MRLFVCSNDDGVDLGAGLAGSGAREKITRAEMRDIHMEGKMGLPTSQQCREQWAAVRYSIKLWYSDYSGFLLFRKTSERSSVGRSVATVRKI